MLYALSCHQFKPDCNKRISDALFILPGISHPWHSAIPLMRNKN